MGASRNCTAERKYQVGTQQTSGTVMSIVPDNFSGQSRSLAADRVERKCTVITVSCGESVAAFPVELTTVNGDGTLPGFQRLVTFLEEQKCTQKCRVSVAGDISDLSTLREAWLKHKLPGDFWVQDTPIGPIAHFSGMVSATELLLGMRITGNILQSEP